MIRERVVAMLDSFKKSLEAESLVRQAAERPMVLETIFRTQ
jgi:hypothetical protein